MKVPLWKTRFFESIKYLLTQKYAWRIHTWFTKIGYAVLEFSLMYNGLFTKVHRVKAYFNANYVDIYLQYSFDLFKSQTTGFEE